MSDDNPQPAPDGLNTSPSGMTGFTNRSVSTGGPGGVINAPIYTFLTILVFLVVMTVLIVSGHSGESGLLIGLGVSTLPSLTASLYAERTARDVRNGVLEEKARLGAMSAIEDTGTVRRDGPAMTLAMASLAKILEEVHAATIENTQQRQADNNGT